MISSPPLQVIPHGFPLSYENNLFTIQETTETFRSIPSGAASINIMFEEIEMEEMWILLPRENEF